MLWVLIVGLIVGAIAKLLMPGKDPGGFIVTMLLGVGGAMVAAFVGKALNVYAPGEPAGIFASVLGAIVLLVIYRAFTNRRRTIPHH